MSGEIEVIAVLFPTWAPTYLVLEVLRRGAFLFDLVSRRLPAGNSASFESAVLPTLVELMERHDRCASRTLS